MSNKTKRILNSTIKNKRITIRVTEEVRKRLEKDAKQNDMTLSDYIRIILNERETTHS